MTCGACKTVLGAEAVLDSATDVLAERLERPAVMRKCEPFERRERLTSR